MGSNKTLEVTTPTDREIAVKRVFDAPRSRVFEAYTRPELLKRWLGVFRGWTLDVCEVDLKVGGAYRYVWRDAARGREMGMGGIFKEIVPSERLVVTEKFDEAWYAGEALVTTVLVEQNGRTTLTATMRYESKAVRDAVLASPMETGMAASYDNLAALLAAEVAPAMARPAHEEVPGRART